MSATLVHRKYTREPLRWEEEKRRQLHSIKIIEWNKCYP